MIEVSIRGDHITMRGHAGHAPKGQDIVCAGVSALFYACLSALEYLTMDEITLTEASNGEVTIGFKQPSDDAIKHIIHFYLGVCEIRDSYPQCVTFD